MRFSEMMNDLHTDAEIGVERLSMASRHIEERQTQKWSYIYECLSYFSLRISTIFGVVLFNYELPFLDHLEDWQWNRSMKRLKKQSHGQS